MNVDHRALRAQSLTIRPMQVQDIDRVHQIDGLSFTLPWPMNSYRYELLDNRASRSLVGEVPHEDGSVEVVGMIVTWFIVDEAHIATLAVHPDFRGFGIGEKLVVMALLQAIKEEMRSATLEVRAGNLAAQALYHKLGFTEVGRRLRYYKDNQEDALIMTVTLNEKNISKLVQNYESSGGR